ncbi:cytochrome c-type biogenesis protein CcmH [Alsobacter sp. SYSU M60028]|uniref:Cytochrome c-type biogenesis protein n=1 Tax=Alsobacter ponti TaxID=2962936 RepID=A0ABT1L899_9HYPH|nr:cytochrome c-type biogenesis protein [Alsobacter ponti]MCP8937727.1 cytochrome c-type biogenesis protein CcmH [Alsobacter ponti]
MRARRLAAAVLALAFAALSQAAPALAVQPDEILKDPVLEARARAISAELRCLVCQNQSIDDSDAPLARDLRLIVREKLTKGASDAEIRTFLVDRYGEFVLLRPPFNAGTALLWLGPFAVLIGGAAVVWANARRRRPAAPSALTDEEKRELEEVAGR